ncbi:MAG: hypothetical protein ACWA5A_09385 [Marinibacterium sp.]
MHPATHATTHPASATAALAPAGPAAGAASRARRIAASKVLADQILSAFAAGRTGQSLRDLFRRTPYDFTRTPQGTSLRLWGLETPPCDNETLAMLCWANMALGIGV